MRGEKEESKTKSVAKQKLSLLEYLPTANLNPNCLSVCLSLSLSQSLSVFQNISGVIVGKWQHIFQHTQKCDFTWNLSPPTLDYLVCKEI